VTSTSWIDEDLPAGSALCERSQPGLDHLVEADDATEDRSKVTLAEDAQRCRKVGSAHVRHRRDDLELAHGEVEEVDGARSVVQSDEQDPPAPPDHAQRGRETPRRTGRLDDDIDSFTRRLVEDSIMKVLVAPVEDVVRPEERRDPAAVLLRSITWDQGTEMARHLDIAASLRTRVYFCDSRSPWQRGSNENTNGLLRQYFPKGTDLAVHAPEHLRAVEDELNRRPRIVLDDRAPADLFNELLASSTGQVLRR
jgi:hypothetical protein